MPVDHSLTDQLHTELKQQLAEAPDLPNLTYQEAHFATAIASGISVATAAARSGVTPVTGHQWVKREDIVLTIEHLKERRMGEMTRTVSYTLEDAHMDIEHAKRMAENSMEYLRGVDMQIKIHGIGAEQNRHAPTVNINVNNISRADQLEALDDDALLTLAGDDFARLQPENG